MPSPHLKNRFACLLNWLHFKRILTVLPSFPSSMVLRNPLTRILRRQDIKVVNKPLKTLQEECHSSRFRPSIEHHPNLVYKIPCADFDWRHADKVDRCFKTRDKEHIRNVKTCANGSNVAKHAWSFDHRIDFDDNSSAPDKGSLHIKKTLEHTLAHTCYQAC